MVHNLPTGLVSWQVFGGLFTHQQAERRSGGADSAWSGSKRVPPKLRSNSLVTFTFESDVIMMSILPFAPGLIQTLGSTCQVIPLLS